MLFNSPSYHKTHYDHFNLHFKFFCVFMEFFQSLCNFLANYSMTDSPSFDENEVLELTAQDLGPKATEFVRMRIRQEISTINKERERVLQTMKDEILHMKQRLLYDLCTKMQNVAFSDHSNFDTYKDKCPDLFTRFSQKNTKKRMRKKPKLQKVNIPFSTFNHHLDTNTILTDIACVRKSECQHKVCTDPFVQMTTNNGQKWLVQRIPIDDNLTKLKYCDGSSSSITPTDIETLNLQFTSIEK
ncbi:hypothetical protein TRFO_03149 [Tritrichomonas foetus]|uniref:Uncharacterized protein n=1 Tax=Tritrichomonas foetus TaxID=1144522 RepID=A0A1J4KTB2_9EUKA|nr:hypothetical protein TRFO_03149 [Tritrichomonas foetus]|eukprot:OHT14120.1 hypothetical protein TRFO_03149 [Tritrichomonas foetus]